MHTATDEELAIRAQAGDKAAFGVLVTRHRMLVLNMCRRWIGQDDLARELTQETFLQALLSLDRLRDPAHIKSWLVGIARNLCRMHWRNPHTNMLSLEAMTGGVHVDIADSGLTPEKIAEHLELRETIQRTLWTLSDAHRQAVILYYYDALPVRDAAALLSISEGAFKARLHRARHQLRERLVASVRPSTVSTEQGDSTMIRVQLVDVVERIYDEASGNPRTVYQLVLLDDTDNRAVMIWVGEQEGMYIALHLLGNGNRLRPMTHTLALNLLHAAGSELQSVHIDRLEDEVFYATLHVTVNGETKAVDARPSDAIALAISTEEPLPIYVEDAILGDVGFALPDDYTLQRGGVAAIETALEEQRQQMIAHRERIEAKPDDARDAGREWDKNRVKRLTFGIGEA